MCEFCHHRFFWLQDEFQRNHTVQKLNESLAFFVLARDNQHLVRHSKGQQITITVIHQRANNGIHITLNQLELVIVSLLFRPSF